MGNKERQIRRTRRALAAALVELVNERGYDAITIRDITEQADIGYATFFRHYKSKDGLMLSVLNDIMEQLEHLADEHHEGFFVNRGRLLFEHVEENAALYQSLLNSPTFARQLRSHFTQEMLMTMQQYAGHLDNPAVPLEVAANHCVAAMMGLIDWWLEAAKPYNVDEMAAIYERLIISATWHVIPADNPIVFPWTLK